MQRGVTSSPPDLVSAFLCPLQASSSVSRVFQRPLRRSAARLECALSLHRVYCSKSPLCMCARMTSTVWLHAYARARAPSAPPVRMRSINTRGFLARLQILKPLFLLSVIMIIWRLFQIAVERAAPVMKKCLKRSPYKQVIKLVIVFQASSFIVIYSVDMKCKATMNKTETRNPIQYHEDAQGLSSVIQDQEYLISYLRTLSELATSLLQYH